MVRNKQKLEQALSLRKRGFTLEEIAKICEISKSTASKWLKNKAFSADVTRQNKARAGAENAKRLKLISKARGAERKQRYADAVSSAKVEFAHYRTQPAFVAGVALYMAAGSDSSDVARIRFSHIEADLHRTFQHFAAEYLGVSREKIHLWLQLYQGANEEKAVKAWSKRSGIPYARFYKNHYVQTVQKHPLHFGVGNTIIASTYHRQKLDEWCRLAKKAW